MNVKLLAKVAISCFFLWVVFHAVDVRGAIKTARDVELGLLLGGLVLNIAGAMYFNALQYKWALFDRRSVSQWQFIKVGFIIRFYMLLFPNAVTTAYRWWRFKQLGIESLEAMHLMIINKSVQMALAGCFIVMAVAWNHALAERIGGRGGDISIINVIVISLLLAITGGIALIRSKALQATLGRVLRTRRLAGIAGRWEKYTASVQAVSRRVLIGNVVLGAVSHLLIIASQQCVCYGIGLELTFLDVAFVRSLVVVLLSIPISIAGLGLREAGFVGGLALVGGEPESALALSLLLLFFQLIIGAVGFWFVASEALERRRAFGR